MNRFIALSIFFLLMLNVPARSEGLDAEQDFKSRCEGPGVVRCWNFNDTKDFTGHTFAGNDGTTRIEIAADQKASGAGSMKFTVPNGTGADPTGSWWSNIKDDYSVQFGEGEVFYVQWRQRFSPEMLRQFTATPTGSGELTAWKQIILGQGDDGIHNTQYSCTSLELVLNQGRQPVYNGFAYHSCGRNIPFDWYDGVSIRMQHHDSPFCYYPDDPLKGCFHYGANEWMTFQYMVQIGNWNTKTSRIKIWAAHEGQPSVLIHDSIDAFPEGFTIWNTDYPGDSNNPNIKYGKIWFTPYMTRKDPAELHATAYTWYDDLIVSSQPIPDPVTGPMPDIDAPMVGIVSPSNGGTVSRFK
jgi:hypothetical protein